MDKIAVFDIKILHENGVKNVKLEKTSAANVAK